MWHKGSRQVRPSRCIDVHQIRYSRKIAQRDAQALAVRRVGTPAVPEMVGPCSFCTGAHRRWLYNLRISADVTIAKLAETIEEMVGVGDPRADRQRSDETPRKLLDVRRTGALRAR